MSNIDGLVRQFSEMSRHGQNLVLARLAYELTILARGTHELSSHNPYCVCLNELLHRVSGSILDRLLDKAERVPDDVIINMCVNGDGELSSQVSPLLKRLLREYAHC